MPPDRMHSLSSPHQPSKKSDSASRPSSTARDSLLNATEHVLRQYSPENFIRLPTSLKGKSELLADVAVAIAVASLTLADADVCAEDAAAAVAATVAVAVDVVDENLRSFLLFNLAGAALAEVVATTPSPSLGVMA